MSAHLRLADGEVNVRKRPTAVLPTESVYPILFLANYGRSVRSDPRQHYRFDGKFFVAVKTTGVYCRPISPARPKLENVEFFPDAASAEKAGYRPCLRCRPECAPLSAAWFGKKAVVQRALKLIARNEFHRTNEEEFAARR